MGAAGRLGVLLSYFYVFLWLMGWVGVGWDVNVHVTLMMLR